MLIAWKDLLTILRFVLRVLLAAWVIAILFLVSTFSAGCSPAASSPREPGIASQTGSAISQTLRQPQDPKDSAIQKQEVERETVIRVPGGGVYERGVRTLADGSVENYDRVTGGEAFPVETREKERASTEIGGTFDFSSVYAKAVEIASRGGERLWIYVLGALLIGLGALVAFKFGWPTPGACVAGSGLALIILYEYAGAIAWLALLGLVVAVLVKLANQAKSD